MYHGERKKNRIWIAVVAAIVSLALIAGLAFGKAREDLSAQSEAAICAAVQKSALQCYAVEGVYPPDLDYLQAHYGLQVNTGDYFIVYEAFSSNLPPTVRVIHK